MIRVLERQPIVDKEALADMREVLDQAERGEVTGLVLVANIPDEKAYFRAASFENGWHLLGAIEHAKDTVIKGMDR